MLWTIAIIFALIWVLGIVTSVTLGGHIHVLLGAAVTLLVLHLIQSRKRSKPTRRGG